MSDAIVAVIALPSFTQDIRRLKKKYRSLLKDLQPTIKQLEGGEIPGDQIAGIGYAVFKVRVKNSDAQRGKSGGYRVIYYLKTTTTVFLLTIYSKSKQDDVMADDLRSIIEAYDRQNGDMPGKGAIGE